MSGTPIARDEYPGCFGCGQENERGLQMRFVRTGEQSVECRYATDDFLRRYWSDEMADLRPDPEIAPRDDVSIQAVCGTGRSSFTLDPYGNVLPCVQWRRPLGNLRDAASFDEIWSDTNPVLTEVRDKAVEMSDILNRQEHGRFAPYCLGVAEVQTGDPMGMYPQFIPKTIVG